MNYRKRRTELAEKARIHTEYMAKLYSAEIAQSLANSKVFSATSLPKDNIAENQPQISFVRKTTDAALFDIPNRESACVLNFASYRNPGGGFITGAMAQEESLCHASFLYNVLAAFSNYYEYNNNHTNKGLYLERAIYSQNIRFFHGRWTRFADVLTCAAPNRSAIKQGNFTEAENQQVLARRIKFIIHVINAAENPAGNVILGAFGCGVLKQIPELVAELFYKYCPLLKKTKHVIFAIPDDKIKIFQQVFTSS